MGVGPKINLFRVLFNISKSNLVNRLTKYNKRRYTFTFKNESHYHQTHKHYEKVFLEHAPYAQRYLRIHCLRQRR